MNATQYLDERIPALRAHALKRARLCKPGGDSAHAWARIVQECNESNTLKGIQDTLYYLSVLRHVPRRQRDIFSALSRAIRKGEWG